MTVIVTRAAAEAESFAARLQSAGVPAVVSPVIEIEIADCAVDLAGVGALAFTSSNGVRAFAQNAAERRLPVFAVGEATAETARGAGFTAVQIAGGDVEALAALIIARRGDVSGAVLHAVGRDKAGDLVGALEKAGIAAKTQVLYAARPAAALAPQAERLIANARADDAVAFFSPRTAALFVELCARRNLKDAALGLTALCLSDAVAQAAEAAGFSRVRAAPARNADAMALLAREECGPHA